MVGCCLVGTTLDTDVFEYFNTGGYDACDAVEDIAPGEYSACGVQEAGVKSCSDESLKSDSEIYVSCVKAQADSLGISSGTSHPAVVVFSI